MTTTNEMVTASTIAAVSRFETALNHRDIDAILAAMTEDCVFETTLPIPDGTRLEGQAAVRAAWEQFFRASPHATFESEETFAWGDRSVVRWRYRWTDASGRAGHVRGVDIIRVRDGKVAETLAYVKG